MKSKQFAICDSDGQYLKMIHAYMQKKNPADFEILTFDSVDKAVSASENEAFEILLVGERTYNKDVKKINVAKIFILQEDGLSSINEYSAIAKYQSMEKLIGEVLEEFALDDKCGSIHRCGKNKTSLISFYSPDHHRAQSLAAFGTAQILADRGYKVLYLNLMAFTGFEELMNISYESDITDFMYFVLNHSDKLLYKLDGMKRSVHGVDYLPPVLDYADLIRIDGKDWERAIDTIIYAGDYTHIVMDMSETCHGFYGILDKSDKIYTLYDNTANIGRAVISHYRRLLKAKEYESILSKTIEFSLPYDIDRGCGQIENLTASPIGSYMKGIV
jgi:hypothetical protein